MGPISGGMMISIGKETNSTIYEQIYRQLKEQILSGIFPPGSRLPATRTFADDYHVSRNSVLAAYRQLLSEGYIRSRTGSGYYVEDIALESPAAAPPHPDAPAASPQIPPFRFPYGKLDLNVYRTRDFRRCMMNAMAEMEKRDVLSYQDPQGEACLRDAIARDLAASRGIHASSSQICVSGGLEQSLTLIRRLFPKDSWSFSTEDPAYPCARRLFSSLGYTVHPIRSGPEGPDPEQLSGLRHTLLYLTPSHQFPLGFVLPVGKRLSLLQWAEETDSYILEDDYDSELRYHEKPIPSLRSYDRKGRVIYLGTFSKTLSPELRASYFVLPETLRLDFDTQYNYNGSSVPVLEQIALAEYISGGYYQKRLNFLRNSLKKRHDLIFRTLEAALGDHVQLYGKNGGYHLVMQIRTSLSEDALIQTLTDAGIELLPARPYYADPDDCPAHMVLLGYGAISLEQLPDYLEALTKCI